MKKNNKKEDKIISITKLKIHNFKSFKDLEINLNNFNILVGCNASGKSNFISIFEFLRDIVRGVGLKNSISLQGGFEFFKNINLKLANEFSLEISSNQKIRTPISINNKKGKGETIGMVTDEIIYSFTLLFSENKLDVKAIEDKLNIKCSFFELEHKKQKYEEKQKLGEGNFSFINNNGKIKYDFLAPKEVKIKKELFFPKRLIEEFLTRKTLLIETPLFIIPFDLSGIFYNIAIYNFEPRKPKKAIPINVKTELEEDGSNFAKALKNILENDDKRRKFSNLIKDILPFVKDLNVVKFVDQSLFVTLEEIYSKKDYLPAYSISDGTINIALLIIALYFEKKLLTIIEEPERNLHPYLISKIVDMMKEVSKKRQIITTTHNPEMLKHADLKDILLVSRDKDGFSKITRPSEKKEIKIFLQNDLGIDEIFANNLLGSCDEL